MRGFIQAMAAAFAATVAALSIAASPEPASSTAPTAASSAPSSAADASAQEVRRSRLESFNPAMPEAPGSQALTDRETQQAYKMALRAYYAYRTQGYEHRRQVFEWQSWSSKAIFIVVLLLVFSGIVFAALQFGAGMRHPKTAPDATTEFVVDLKGIQVRSPVLGVVVLAISLAFFYLNLVYVYPIVNVF